MPIFKKSALERDLMELEQRYQKLRDALEGMEPNRNLFHRYEDDEQQYLADYVELKLDDVEYALHDFDGVLRRLRTANLKKRKAPARS